ncbi:YdcF family protein [Oricola cellulosilytica]|nr:YdcF family protein [Oricola cellulosilytica]
MDSGIGMQATDETQNEKRSSSARAWRRAASVGAIVFLGAAAAVIVGFLLFASWVSDLRSVQATRAADGIVVLTGGYDRIGAALKLLEEERGSRLLISGVNPSTSRDVLRRTFASDVARFRCCVDVDNVALDTIGNAVETSRWAADRGYSSLIVVTNDYHMPRSLLEMRRYMAGIELIPHAVAARRNDEQSVSDEAARYRLLFAEYIKYSAAQFRHLIAPLRDDQLQTQRAALVPGS